MYDSALDHDQAELKQLRKELVQAKQEVLYATIQFNTADQDFVDVAVFALTGAQAKYNSLLSRYRKQVL